MLHRLLAPPFELLLKISVTAEGKLEVLPCGLRGDIRPFLMEPVLSRTIDSSAVAQHPEALGADYYTALFAERAPTKEWLEARIAAGSGRLIFVEAPEVPLELWETLETPNKKPVMLQGISIERRLAEVAPAPVPSDPLQESLRGLWVAPEKGTDSDDSGARRIMRLFDGEAIVDCKPPTLQKMQEVLLAARRNGAPFQAVHLEGRGFLEFKKGRDGGVLLFQNPHGGGVSVNIDELRAAFLGLSLVVLEDDSVGGALDVVPYLHELGVPSVIVVPFSKQTDQAFRFATRFYDGLGAGETIAEAVNAGRRTLRPDADLRPASTKTPSVDLRGWWSVQLYQQGPDGALVQAKESLSTVSGRRSTAAPSQISTQPVLASTAVVSPTPTGRFRPRTILIAGLLMSCLAVLAWGLARTSRQSELAEEKSRLDKELAAEKSRIDEEVDSCLNPSEHHCTVALRLLEECVSRKRADWWPKCSYQIGYIKDKGLSRESDLPGALTAYERACDGGHGQGCLNLGLMKQEGRGLAQPNFLDARRDFERGCSHDNREACHNAGLLYATDDPAHGLVVDLTRAQPFYSRACNEGRSTPNVCIGWGTILLDKLGDRDGAYKWFSLGCLNGDLFGCTRQADVATNPTEREGLYRKACDVLDSRRGACSGCLPLAKLLGKKPGRETDAFLLLHELCHEGCQKNDTQARSCCQDTAVRGPACHLLGWIEEEGMLNRPVNAVAAQTDYRQGCNIGDKESCGRLEHLCPTPVEQKPARPSR